MLLTGRRLSGEEAASRGLVAQIVSPEELFQAGIAMAKKIASYDPAAVRNAKLAVLKGSDLSLEQGLELEWRLAAVTNPKK